MNIVIPMGGNATRFTDQGYRYPKPLINIVGRPMIYWLLDNLDLNSEDTIWLAYPQSMDTSFGFSKRLHSEYPNVKFRKVILSFQTRGPAETLFMITQQMSPEDLKRKTISIDSDMIFFENVLQKFRDVETGLGCCFYFDDDGEKPIYSYISLNSKGLLTEIREKVAISSNANAGAYGFASGQLLRQYCMKALDSTSSASGPMGGEYYLSSIIRMMLADKEPFKGIEVLDFAGVGTPEELEAFLGDIAEGRIQVRRKLRFCFDLDNTLVTAPDIPGDYSTVHPIPKNITLVRQLNAIGHSILIWTARKMRTHQGNIGSVMKDIGRTTFNTLEELGIPYDEIYFGKPYAHVYVDDLAVNALLDTEKEIGWLSERKASEESKANFVAPRHFNSIQVIGDAVIKSSSDESILGEVYFYEHIPDDCKDLFPKLINVERIRRDEMLRSAAAGTSSPRSWVLSITMEKVTGVTYNSLLMGKVITDGRLTKLLTALHRIHNSDGKSTYAGTTTTWDDVDMYGNGARKVEQRFKKFSPVYDRLKALFGPDRVNSAFRAVLKFLQEYEAADRATRARAIHGDPVFSNVLLVNDGRVILLDMRGAQGSTLTTSGDMLYDLGKVYQSLSGYDHALTYSRLPDELESTYLQGLREVFTNFLTAHYKIPLKDVQMQTASLLFSLIPLHDSLKNHELFFELCEQAIARAQ